MNKNSNLERESKNDVSDNVDEFNFFNHKPTQDTFEDNALPDISHRSFLDFLVEILTLSLLAITLAFVFDNYELNQPKNNYPEILSVTKYPDGSSIRYYSNGVVVDVKADGSFTAKLTTD